MAKGHVSWALWAQVTRGIQGHVPQGNSFIKMLRKDGKLPGPNCSEFNMAFMQL